MAILGVIAEFNPFHNGHKYLIDSIKGENDTLICVISGNYVQRGDTAVFSKNVRTKAAMLNGADIVAELPTPYAMSNAENFAFGAVNILKQLNADTICFGSETANISALLKIAEIRNTEKFKHILSKYLNEGITYAAAYEKAVAEIDVNLSALLKNPNDTLAVEYISACNKLNFRPKFKVIKRKGVKHNGNEVSGKYASATYIRTEIQNGNFEKIKKYIPENTYELYNTDFSNINNISRVFPAVLRLKNAEYFKKLPDLSEGIENRLIKAVAKYGTYGEICNYTKSKRYTLARVRRLVINALLNTDGKFAQNNPPYIRVLGFNTKGEKLIKNISKQIKTPIIIRASDIENCSDEAKQLFKFESNASDIYALTFNTPLKKGTEITNKLIKHK